MLLIDLLKNTPPNHKDYAFTERALRMIQEVALTMEAGINFTVQKELMGQIFKEISDLPVSSNLFSLLTLTNYSFSKKRTTFSATE